MKTLRTRLLTFLVLPTALVILATLALVFEPIDLLQHAETSSRALEEARALDQFVTSVQRERGLTAAHLASDQTAFLPQLEHERRIVDQRANELRSLHETDPNPSPAIATLLTKLQSLGGVRSRVDAGTSMEAFAYYSELAADALHLMRTLADPRVDESGRFWVTLLQVQEAAGKERAMIARALAGGDGADRSLLDAVGQRRIQQALLAEIDAIAPPDLRHRLRTVHQGDAFTRVNAVREAVDVHLDDRIVGIDRGGRGGPAAPSPLDAFSADGWWKASTDRIEAYRTLGVHAVEQIENGADESRVAAERTVMIALGAGLLFIALPFLFARRMWQRLEALDHVAHNLARLAQNGDVGAPHPVGNHDDEIALLELALDQFRSRELMLTRDLEALSDGDLRVECKVRSESDGLSRAVLQLTHDLRDATLQAEAIANGVQSERLDAAGPFAAVLVDVTDELRSTREDALDGVRRAKLLEELSESIRGELPSTEIAARTIDWLCQALGFPVGAVFKQEGSALRRIAAYGLNGHRSALRVLRGEGLVGQCAASGTPIEVSCHREEHLQIKSSLLNDSPSHVMVHPIRIQDEPQIYGVVELGALQEPDALTRNLLPRAMEIIAIAMRSAMAREAIESQRAALVLSEARIRAILDAASDAILSVDERGIVRSANRATIEMFGSARISGQPISRLIPDLQREDLGSAPRTWTGRRQDDGTEFPVHVAMSRIQVEGRVAYAGIIRDVSAVEEWERRLTEQAQELKRRNTELQSAKMRAEQQAVEMEQQSRFKSEFLANMSHELRTPLNSLLILAGVLAENRRGNLSDTEVDYAQTISSSGNDLLQLINDILDMAKVESGNLEIDIQPTPVVEITERVTRMFTPVARKAGLPLDVHVDPELPDVLRLDPTRLAQILNNLLSNAFKFTSDGAVTLSLLRSEERFVVTVRDTGIGIPEDRRDAIFDAFKQVDAGTTRKFGGTGLGLAISRQLAELMGGSLTVASEEQVGSTFTLDLPLDPHGASQPAQPPVARPRPVAPSAPDTHNGPTPDASIAAPPSQAPLPPVERPVLAAEPAILADVPDATPSEDPQWTERLDGRRVLVVDDDIRNIFALSCALEAQGIRVVASESATEAYGILEVDAFDAVLMDIMMPDVNGYDAIRHIRTMERGRHIPILALTARAMSGDQERCLDAGADGYIAKPVDLVELLHSLTEVLPAGPVAALAT